MICPKWSIYVANTQKETISIFNLFKEEIAKYNHDMEELCVMTADPNWENFGLICQNLSISLTNYYNKIIFAASAHKTQIMEILWGKVLELYFNTNSKWSHDKRLYHLYLKLRSNKHLDEVQLYSVNKIIHDIEQEGILLSAIQQKKITKLRKQVKNLHKKFNINVTKSIAEAYIIVKTDELLSLPEHVLNTIDIKQEKQQLGLHFCYQLLEFCENKAIRREAYNLIANIASVKQNPKFDNTLIIEKIVHLQSSIAHQLSGVDFATIKIKEDIPSSPDNVLVFLKSLIETVHEKAKEEIKILTAFAGEDLHPWDISFYIRKWKSEKFNKIEKIRFSYTETLNGINAILNDLLDITLEESEIEMDLRWLKVTHIPSKTQLGWLLLDLFNRDHKETGAMMFDYHYSFKNNLPCAAILCNFFATSDNTLSIEDVTVLLHELGHSLHHIMGQSSYFNLSGISVPSSLVELPSQLFEHFFTIPYYINQFACNRITSDEINDIIQSKHSFSNLFIYRQAIYALMDMEIYTKKHQTPRKAVVYIKEQYALIKEEPVAYSENSFLHIFGGGYECGYYVYLWAKIIGDCMFYSLCKQNKHLKELGKILNSMFFSKASLFAHKATYSQADTQLWQFWRKCGKWDVEGSNLRPIG